VLEFPLRKPVDLFLWSVRPATGFVTRTRVGVNESELVAAKNVRIILNSFSDAAR
jgi:hypothetical protein